MFQFRIVLPFRRVFGVQILFHGFTLFFRYRRVDTLGDARPATVIVLSTQRRLAYRIDKPRPQQLGETADSVPVC